MQTADGYAFVGMQRRMMGTIMLLITVVEVGMDAMVRQVVWFAFRGSQKKVSLLAKDWR